MKELNVKEIIKTAVDTYKENWKLLLWISLFSTLLSITVGMLSLIANSLEFSGMQVLLAIVSLVFSIISIYYSARLTVSMIIASKASLMKEEETASSSYRKAKPLTWGYIGYGVLFGLMLVIPLMLILFGILLGDFFDMNFTTRAILVILGGLPAIYLGTIFHFSLFTAVLYSKESSIFTYSKKLVKGNFVKVFMIMMIPLLVTIPVITSDLLFKTTQYSVYIQMIISVFRSIPTMLITPFGLLLSLETMGRLEAMKHIEDEVRENNWVNP